MPDLQVVGEATDRDTTGRCWRWFFDEEPGRQVTVHVEVSDSQHEPFVPVGMLVLQPEPARELKSYLEHDGGEAGEVFARLLQTSWCVERGGRWRG